MQVDTRMQGKICVLTGGTSGIGKAAALGLARMGATVVIVGRNREKGEAVLAEIQAVSGNDALSFLEADLSSQASIRQLAAEIKERHPHLDVLINNAGVFMLKRQLTVDGLEMTFAVNHLAPFLLTNLLLDQLKASAPARIIHVDSNAHEKATIRMDDLQGEKRYGFWHAYGQSKLAMMLCSYELARRLEGTGVTVNAMHPGFVATRFGDASGGFVAPLTRIAKLFAIAPEQGAKTIIHLASSPLVAQTTGEYFVKSRPAVPSEAARDDRAAAQLWQKTAALARIDWP